MPDIKVDTSILPIPNADAPNLRKKQLGNFTVQVFEITSKMKESAEKYAKSANEREKDLEEIWKTSNREKQKLQLELSAHSKNMAVISGLLLVTSIAFQIAAVRLTAPIANGDVDYAKLSQEIGKSLTDSGSRIADQLSSSYTNQTNVQAETWQLAAQKVWDSDKQDFKSRSEEIKTLKQKVDDGLQSAIDKTGAAYSMRG